MQKDGQFFGFGNVGCVQILHDAGFDAGDLEVGQQTDQFMVHRRIAGRELGSHLRPQRLEFRDRDLTLQQRDLHDAQQVQEVLVRDKGLHRRMRFVQNGPGVFRRRVGGHQRQAALDQQAMIVGRQQLVAPRSDGHTFQQSASCQDFRSVVRFQQGDQGVDRWRLASAPQCFAGSATDLAVAVGKQLDQNLFGILVGMQSHPLGRFATHPLVLILRDFGQQLDRRSGAVQLHQFERTHPILPGIGSTGSDGGQQPIPLGAQFLLLCGDLLTAPGRMHLRLTDDGIQSCSPIHRSRRRFAFPQHSIQSADRAASARGEIQAAVRPDVQIADAPGIVFDKHGALGRVACTAGLKCEHRDLPVRPVGDEQRIVVGGGKDIVMVERHSGRRSAPCVQDGGKTIRIVGGPTAVTTPPTELGARRHVIQRCQLIPRSPQIRFFVTVESEQIAFAVEGQRVSVSQSSGYRLDPLAVNVHP